MTTEPEDTGQGTGQDTGQNARAVERLRQAIMTLKQQGGLGRELDQLQAALDEPQVDPLLLATECLVVLAGELVRLQREVEELRWRVQ
jgi:hypothetical protein